MFPNAIYCSETQATYTSLGANYKTVVTTSNDFRHRPFAATQRRNPWSLNNHRTVTTCRFTSPKLTIRPQAECVNTAQLRSKCYRMTTESNTWLWTQRFFRIKQVVEKFSTWLSRDEHCQTRDWQVTSSWLTRDELVIYQWRTRDSCFLV